MAGSENNKRKSPEADKDPLAMETEEMSLKFVVDGESKKVLYAEAKKDFIDFLFGLLQVPIGSIMTLLAENGLELGSLRRVVQSVSDMETSHFHWSGIKDAIVKPTVFSGKDRYCFNPPLLLKEFASWEPLRPFSNTTYTYAEGYLIADNCAYMVMDDLVVCPMSTTLVFSVLKKFKIKDPSLLEEKIVKIDLKKGLALVKSSMESDTVLTHFFTSHA